MANANSPTSERMILAKQRQQDALRLRQTGATFEDIGKTLEITPQAAHKAVKRALANLNKTIMLEADQTRALELVRLDRLTMALWSSAIAGGFGAIDRLIKIMERRAKLIGLDIPTGIANLNFNFSDLTDEQLRRIANGENPLHVISTNTGESGTGETSEKATDHTTGEDTNPPNG